MVGEVIGGFISGSISLLTDAAHMLSDLVGFLIAFVSVYVSQKPANPIHSYGYHRAEVIGSLTSILIIWGLTIWLLSEAIKRIENPEPVEGEVMLITAAAGLAANIAMMKILHTHGHGHDHEHSHGHKHGHEHEHEHGHEHDHAHEHDHKHENKDEHKHEHEEHDHEHQNGKMNQKEDGDRKIYAEKKKNPHQHEHNCCGDHENKESAQNEIILQEKDHININIETDKKNTEIQPHTPKKCEENEEEECCTVKKNPVNNNLQSRLINMFTCSGTCKKKEQNKYGEPLQRTLHEANHLAPPSKEILHKNEEKEEKTESKKNNDSTNFNIKAAMIHVLGDFFQSVVVVVGGIIIYYKPDYSIVDPILTFIFSFLVLGTTIPTMKNLLIILMEATPEKFNYKQLKEDLEKIEGVKEVHDLHIWSLTAGKIALSGHLFSENPMSSLKKGTDVCRKYGIYHSTLQVEDWKLKEVEGFIQCKNNLH